MIPMVRGSRWGMWQDFEGKQSSLCFTAAWFYDCRQVTGLPLSLNFPTCKFDLQCRFAARADDNIFSNKQKDQVLGNAMTFQLRSRGCEIPLLRALCKQRGGEEGRRMKGSHQQVMSHGMQRGWAGGADQGKPRLRPACGPPAPGG